MDADACQESARAAGFFKSAWGRGGFLLFVSSVFWVLGHSLLWAAAGPRFKSVFMVVFENADYAEVIKEEPFARVAKLGALLERSSAVSHPSQPNYFALVSGERWVLTNSVADVEAQHLGDLLEAKGLTWRVYAEDFPGNCFLGESSGKYVRKHNPFISFVNVHSDKSRCARIVPASELESDILNQSLPNFAFYVPDMNNNGHDTGVAFAGRWLEKTVEPLLQNPVFMKDRLVIVTFDEGSYKGINRIYTALVGRGVRVGSQSRTAYNHYSVLRTIEQEWGLGSLSQNDMKATPIQGVWLP